MSRASLATILSGALLGLLSLQAAGLRGSWLPILLVPPSIVLIIPRFMNLPAVALPFIVVALFLAWSYPLFRGEPRVPLRTVALLLGVAVLSLAYFVSNWHYGTRNQGLQLTISYAILSAGFAVSAVLAVILASRAPSFRRNLLVHALLFTWILSYAFPYLGYW